MWHLTRSNFQLRVSEDVTGDSVASRLHYTQLCCFSANLILDLIINLKKTIYDLKICSTEIFTYYHVEHIKIFLLWATHYYQHIYNICFLSSSLFCNVDNDDDYIIIILYIDYYITHRKKIAFLTRSHWVSVHVIAIQKLNCSKDFYHAELHWSKALQNTFPRIFTCTILRTEVFISFSKDCGVFNSSSWGWEANQMYLARMKKVVFRLEKVRLNRKTGNQNKTCQLWQQDKVKTKKRRQVKWAHLILWSPNRWCLRLEQYSKRLLGQNTKNLEFVTFSSVAFHHCVCRRSLFQPPGLSYQRVVSSKTIVQKF